MIPFLRGLPNGKFRITAIARGTGAEAAARRFILAGGTYVCEMLGSGRVNMSAVLLRQGQAVEVECAEADNGPPLLRAVDALVEASLRHLPQ